MPTRLPNNPLAISTLWWENAMKTWEIAITAPQVIAKRTARMAAAGANPGKRDREEFIRMGQEKIEAFGESWFEMAMPLFSMNQEFARIAMQQWWQLWSTPMLFIGASPLSGKRTNAALMRGFWAPLRSKKIYRLHSAIVGKGLAPIHKRVTANIKRL